MTALPSGARLVRNRRSLGFAANANAGIAPTTGDAVIVANADVVPRCQGRCQLAAFMASRPTCGIAGPQLVFPDGSWQPSRRRFPTVGGTLVRRTPLRAAFSPRERQREHYGLDARPAEPRAGRLDAGSVPPAATDDARTIGGFDEGFRLYCEDIDLCYRAAKAGWERWYVPEAVVEHAYPAMTDSGFLTRRTVWHWGGMVHFARKHPERLRAL